MDKKNIMIRSFGEGCQLRAADDEKRTIQGYAIVFNERSVSLPDYHIWKMVTEVISPDAISDELLRTSDVIANLEHNNNKLLARCDGGKGTLSLRKDSHGLFVEFDCPNTPFGQQAYEGVKRGDYKGMSFAYRNEDDACNVTYTKEGEGDDVTIIRTVNKIDYLGDVSIVLHPAYQQTSVEARSAENALIEKEIIEAFPEMQKENVRSAEMMRDFDKLELLINN